MSSEVSLPLTADGLSALSEMAIAPKNQLRLDQLLLRSKEGSLSATETEELDLLLRNIDELNLVKARAAILLHQINAEE